MNKISRRLNEIVNMVGNCELIIDIGTDHGYVPIELIKKGYTNRGIAADLRQGALDNAYENISDNNMLDDITLIKSDGLKNIDVEEGSKVVIAGMGGRLLIKIIDDSRDKLKKVKEIILQPQSELSYVRNELNRLNFRIIDEKIVYDMNHFYFIIKVINLKKDEEYDNNYDELSLHYGKVLKNENKVFHEFLLYEKDKCESLINDLKNKGVDVRRINEVYKRLDLVKKALDR